MDKAEATFSAEEVVAAGRTPQSMQFPSPVYFARWIDERHAVIGAGGGGRRFGMANLLALVAIDSTPSRATAKPLKENAVWRFVAAVDLGANVPWCASKFLPCEDSAARARGVVGHVAVSHVTCFSLIEVSRAGALSMRIAACVPVPSDTRNPDKKPIAAVQGAVAVAHDENGIWLFRLSSLLPSDHHNNSGGDNINNNIVQAAEPIAKWALPARVNDLDANRFFVPKRDVKVGTARPLRRYSNYLLLAALVQDKTLRLATMKLRDGTGSSGNSGSSGGEVLVEASVLTGKDCRIPFSLMRSSMRLVQLFGAENIPTAEADAAWRRARRAHCGEGARGAMAVAGAVVVVYDTAANQSHVLTARIASTAAAASAAAAAATEGAQPRDAENNNHTAQNIDNNNMNNKGNGNGSGNGVAPLLSSSSSSSRRHLALQVRFAPQSSVVAADAVTSVSACHCGHSEEPTGAAEGVGTMIPSRWLAATVEGALLFIAYDGKGTFQALDVRPAKNRRIAARFPALHREPISCVAVSRFNDVLTTDIAQNVVVSALPYWERLPLLTSSSEVNGAARTSMRDTDDLHGNIDPQSKKSMSLRSKYEFLSLFQSKAESAPFSLHWMCSLSPKQILLAALLLVPLVAISTTCFRGINTPSKSFTFPKEQASVNEDIGLKSMASPGRQAEIKPQMSGAE